MTRRADVILLGAVMCLAVTVSAGQAGIPCSSTSSVWAETYSSTVGDSVMVHAIVRDCYGSPLPGSCVFFMGRSGADDVIGNPGIADSSGLASARIATSVPGQSLLYANCSSGTSGQVLVGPAAAPIHWANKPRPLVSTLDDRIMIAYTRDVQMYDLSGHLVTSTTTCTAADVYPVTSDVGETRVVIVDSCGVAIYYPDGSPVASKIPTTGWGTLAKVDSRIVIIDENGFIIDDFDGNQLIPRILTTGRATAVTIDSRIIIIDNNSVSIYDLDGNLLIPKIITTGRATVTTVDSRIIIIDDTGVLIYDLDGNLLVPRISTTGRATVTTVDSRIIIIDNDGVLIYDLGGFLLTPKIATVGRATVTIVDSRIIIIDDTGVWIYDLDGFLKTSKIATVGRATVTTVDSRIIIIDDTGVWIYDLDGLLKTSKIATVGRATVITVDSRIIIIDDAGVLIYDLDGFLLAPKIPTVGRGTVITVDSRIIIIDAAGVHLYDLNGTLVSIMGAGIETEKPYPVSETLLFQNRPNPFGKATEIEYMLATACLVRVTIYNSLGQEVRTLVDGRESAGLHIARWDGKGDDGSRAASGIYFYRLRAGAFVATKEMLLVR